MTRCHVRAANFAANPEVARSSGQKSLGREIECGMTPPSSPPTLDLDVVLTDLARLDHIQGGLVVSPDGRVMAIHLPQDIAVEPLAALAATLGRDLDLRTSRGRRGTFLMAHVAAGDGTVFLCDTPAGFIVLLAEADVNREAVRHALRATMNLVRQACA
jgi:predicted regulator of Ras-like GTPase activity (Roadblock/LC7/MglB family)